jgi:hypothetical protein
MNVLDLCFFRSLHSLTDTRAPATIKELIEAVDEEYHNYDVDKLARSFSTLKDYMAKVMKVGGGIRYDIQHKKDRQQVEDMVISITADLLAQTKAIMEEGTVDKENKQQTKQPERSQAAINKQSKQNEVRMNEVIIFLSLLSS